MVDIKYKITYPSDLNDTSSQDAALQIYAAVSCLLAYRKYILSHVIEDGNIYIQKGRKTSEVRHHYTPKFFSFFRCCG
jgi:hypothetical protein